jgi:hypothetical protein
METQKKEDDNCRPSKRVRVDNVSTKQPSDDQRFGPTVDYIYAKEMRVVLQKMKKEIELHSACSTNMFDLDQRLVILTIEQLVATEGHFLGASSCLSAGEFNAIVNTRITELKGNHELALIRCNEARCIQLILGADYIAIEESDDGNTEKVMETDNCVFPTHSTNSFICNFGEKKFRLDKANSVLKRTRFGKRNQSQSLKQGNEDRKKLRGNTLALVVQSMMCFMGVANHIAGSESGLAIGGYALIKSRYGGHVNMPYLNMNDAPANMETMYARTMYAVGTNSNHRKVVSKLHTGKPVELFVQSSLAWRHDAVLGQHLRRNLWEPTRLPFDDARSSSLYDCSLSNKGSEFGSVFDHMKRSTNMLYTKRLGSLFENGGAGTRFVNDNIIGKGRVEYFSHKVANQSSGQSITSRHDNQNDLYNQAPEEGGAESLADRESEAGVWMIRDPISRQLKDEVIREVNRLSFIGSSQDVGANTKKKSRYYRMSTMCKSGGLFQLSSDPRLIDCQPTEGIEKNWWT